MQFGSDAREGADPRPNFIRVGAKCWNIRVSECTSNRDNHSVRTISREDSVPLCPQQEKVAMKNAKKNTPANSAAVILKGMDTKIVGKTVKQVLQQQFGFQIEFVDGTSCAIWSTPDDTIVLGPNAF